MKLALVEWLDSCGISGWHTLSGNDSASKCITVGTLCKDSEKEVVLALSKSDSGNVSDTIAIPKICITRIRYLKVSK